MKYYTGRRKIFITEKSSEITKDNIFDIMQDIMPIIRENFVETNYLYSYYKGFQPILQKERPTEEDPIKNNVVLENHAYKLVNFKTSYLISDGFKYSQVDDKTTDDVTILNRYYADENKIAKDTELAENMYISGTGYRFIQPKKGKYDINGESPFEIITLDNNKTFVAYTTDVGKAEALSGYVVRISDDEYKFTLYTDEKVFECTSNSKFDFNRNSIKEDVNTIGMNPIIEYPLNKSRMGVVDVVYSVLNAINIVSSNQVDDIVDFVNSILVFYNMNVDPQRVKELRKIGALEAKDINPQSPARVEYVSEQLNHSDINEFYDRLVKIAYDIVGVPIASGQVTSGGDTGEARKLGNGYESADLMIKLEETSFIASERKSLKIQLKICKGIRGCKINELFASDIAINPTRHNLDNILSKVQALKMLYDMKFPREAALILTSLGANPHELATQWEETENKKKEENAALFGNTQLQNNATEKETDSEEGNKTDKTVNSENNPIDINNQRNSDPKEK